MNSPYEKYQGFTEGPWTSTTWPEFTVIMNEEEPSSNDGIVIANLKNGTRDLHSNAELIAAAPLLLQDCREMWEELSEIAEIFEENNFHGSAMEVRSLLNRIKERHNG